MAKITRLTLDQSGGFERRRLHLHEISEDSDVPLETVGQDLRKARLRKGEDLATIATNLKIRKDQLEALEESNFDRMPGRAYTIGFVRAYAQYLGLHAGECVERLKAEIAGRTEVKEPVMAASLPSETRLPPGGVMLAIFLAIALVYVGYYVVVTIGRMHTPAVTPVPARLSEMIEPNLIPPVPQRVAGEPTMTQLSARPGESAQGHL
ncbi:MAG TPA: helix-turn-helix domain-containing protein [Micropepsaceae bacterium]|nr:helix-turn-helix domain-containing protein [Micropepsaceae bacterium]